MDTVTVIAQDTFLGAIDGIHNEVYEGGEVYDLPTDFAMPLIRDGLVKPTDEGKNKAEEQTGNEAEQKEEPAPVSVQPKHEVVPQQPARPAQATRPPFPPAKPNNNRR